MRSVPSQPGHPASAIDKGPAHITNRPFMLAHNILANAPTVAIESASKATEMVAQHGTFAVGSLFGAALSCFIFWLVSRQQRERLEADIKREEELRKQLDLKEQRIDELHGLLNKSRSKQK